MTRLRAGVESVEDGDMGLFRHWTWSTCRCPVPSPSAPTGLPRAARVHRSRSVPPAPTLPRTSTIRKAPAAAVGAVHPDRCFLAAADDVILQNISTGASSIENVSRAASMLKGLEGARHPRQARRFRHRILVANLSAVVSARPHQDRPFVHRKPPPQRASRSRSCAPRSALRTASACPRSPKASRPQTSSQRWSAKAATRCRAFHRPPAPDRSLRTHRAAGYLRVRLTV